MLLLVSAPGLLRRIGAINVEHLADRFGTLVIIALGESVLAIVIAVSTTLTPLSAVVAVLSFVITAGLAWAMFMFGIDTMRAGLVQLVRRGDARGVVETVAFLPFVLLAGIMMLAGAVSLAIEHPLSALPPSAAVSLGGGVILFYGTNAIISLRFGTPWRSVAPWAVPAIVLPLVVGIAAFVIPAIWSVAAMAATVLGLVTLSEIRARHRVDAGDPRAGGYRQ